MKKYEQGRHTLAAAQKTLAAEYMRATDRMRHEQSRGKRLVCIAMMRIIKRMVALLIMIAAAPHHGFSQSNTDLQAFFRQSVGLNEDQIAAIRNGQAVATAVPSRTPAEIFLFGAVYIHAAPEAGVRLAHGFDRLTIRLHGQLL